MRRQLVTAAFGVVAWCFFSFGALSQGVKEPRIWLSGVDPFVRQVMNAGPSDYMDLFKANAPWAAAASRVSVFKTSTQWILNAPADDLVRMFQGLQNRGIELAVEALILTRENGGCGLGIEGYSSPNTMHRAAERIRSLGGTLSYLAFDEPLWFGHVYSGVNSCRAPLQDVAENVVRSVRQVKAVFPNVKIGDIEPLPQHQPSEWIETLLLWIDKFGALGLPLDFFHVDIEWLADPSATLNRLAVELGARAVQLGVIYNGDHEDLDDVSWTTSAERHFDQVEAKSGFLPGDAVIQTWMKYPTRMLPETDPGTVTYLINRYSRERPALSVNRHLESVEGRLTRRDGRPIADARISISRLESGTDGALVTQETSGIVPVGAQTAVMGLRINTECGCSGQGDVGVGPIRFSAQNGEHIAMLPRGRSEDVEHSGVSVQVSQFTVLPGTEVHVTSPPFPVEQSARYNVTIPMRATSDVGRAGYLALIFLGRDGREIKRTRLALQQGNQKIVTLRTSESGNFVYQLGAKVTASEYNVMFDGDDNYRAVFSKLND